MATITSVLSVAVHKWRFLMWVAALPLVLGGLLLAVSSGIADADCPLFFHRAWGQPGALPGEFNTPLSLASGPDGRLYVADTNNGRVQAFSPSGTFFSEWGVGGEPLGIAFGPDYGYAALANSYVVKFTMAGTVRTVWGGPGLAPNQFRGRAADLAVGSLYVHVVDDSGYVLRFTTNGVFNLRWSCPMARGIAVDAGGFVYVSEHLTHRIHRYSGGGVEIASWGGLGSDPGQLDHPTGLAIDVAGDLYVADTRNNRIQKFSSNGALLCSGVQGNGPNALNAPADVSPAASDLVYVADAGNHRIQQFGLRDTIPPTILCPPDTTIRFGPAGAYVVYAAPRVVDDLDLSPTVSCAPASGSLFPVGTNVVGCTATDFSGNSSQCTFDVTVLGESDTIAPTISCPSDTTIRFGPARVQYPTVTAVDNLDPQPIVTCSPISGSRFPVGTTAVVCTATDSSGNTAQCAFDVTIAEEPRPLQDGARIDEMALACGNGDRTVQFIELTTTLADQIFYGGLGLEVEDRFGTLLMSEWNLFQPRPVGEPWPVGSRWLVGTASLEGATGLIPDLVLDLELDPYGGRIRLLLAEPAGDRTLHEVVYGTVGGVNAPAPGQSLQREDDDSMVEKSRPDPSNHSGATSDGLFCPCPTNVLEGSCFETLYSTRAAESVFGPCAYYESGSGASYDLVAGIVTAGASGRCETGAAATATITDVYHVRGVGAGTPVTLTVNARMAMSSYSQTCTVPISKWIAGRLVAGGIERGVSGSFDTTLAIPVTVVANEPFAVSIRLDVSAGGGGASATGRLSFSDLPPGADVVSCQGFMPDLPTATLVSAIDATAGADRVQVTWLSSGDITERFVVYRREGDQAWAPRGQVRADGVGQIVFEDADVFPGIRYGYRLGVATNGREDFFGEIWVTVPIGEVLALEGPLPNPTERGLIMRITLPRRAPTRIALLDLAGRELLSRDIGSLGAGQHSLDLLEGRALPPGLYVVRLKHGAEIRTAKAVVTR